jgi:hypothetical protein
MVATASVGGLFTDAGERLVPGSPIAASAAALPCSTISAAPDLVMPANQP